MQKNSTDFFITQSRYLAKMSDQWKSGMNRGIIIAYLNALKLLQLCHQCVVDVSLIRLTDVGHGSLNLNITLTTRKNEKNKTKKYKTVGPIVQRVNLWRGCDKCKIFSK